MKKIKIYSEPLYVVAIILLGLAVALLSSAGFGVSMIVAPAYILSLKTGFLSFGQAEYVIQSVLFIVFCCVMKRFKIVYLSSFLTCLIYGAVLDLFRTLPFFNQNITNPESLPFALRIAMFILGAVLTSLSIAMFYKTYFYPQVYDFFVKGVSAKFGIKRTVFKTAFDLTCLTASAVMTLAFFKKFVGINTGTLIIAALNGTVIGIFGKIIDKYFEVVPIFKNFAKKFEII